MKWKGRKKPNRKHKDTVFVDLFSKDRNAENNFRSLYNALFGKELDSDTPIESIHIENVLYANLVTELQFGFEEILSFQKSP